MPTQPRRIRKRETKSSGYGMPEMSPSSRSDCASVRKNLLSALISILTTHPGIQFGTAGLRGRMQAGFSCMNSLTVIQASQGLARFLQQSHSGDEPACVVLGHDARHNSGRFAALAANAFDAVGIKVWWYPTNCPTPHVPFGILVKHAAAGVMVTASHVGAICHCRSLVLIGLTESRPRQR